VKFADKIYLVSNRHVLTGLDPFTNKPLSSEGDLPNQVIIRYNSPGEEPEPWKLQGEDLYEKKAPKWVEKNRL